MIQVINWEKVEHWTVVIDRRLIPVLGVFCVSYAIGLAAKFAYILAMGIGK